MDSKPQLPSKRVRLTVPQAEASSSSQVQPAKSDTWMLLQSMQDRLQRQTKPLKLRELVLMQMLQEQKQTELCGLAEQQRQLQFQERQLQLEKSQELRKERILKATIAMIKEALANSTECDICNENWTKSGAHCIAYLPCGHLFGLSCLIECLQRFAHCPNCRSPSCITDIATVSADVFNKQNTIATQANAVKEDSC